ncbi:class I SAM-dependent DNA methyltransferase [bacterium]|nr:MAG: class I SAM-dependent DNA methyltransferase [bacterium]
MNQEEAKRIIEDTFRNSFDEGRFRLFAKNLLNDLDTDEAKSCQGNRIPDAFKDHIRQFKRLGKYTDPNGKELDVLVVTLKRETALDRARTMQRNFVAKYLKEAALVAYHTEGLEDWRFSFIRMEYVPVEKEGVTRAEEKLTPARRYSFLVGKNEPNHTAQKQLLPILQDDKNNPTLEAIESAFNIESVTKEFFEKYKGLYLQLHDELEGLVAKDPKIREDFTAKGVNTGDFAKKLLGQIVFLYFLQKKGWLGVKKDSEGNFGKWGSGPKDFLQKLFRKEIVPYENFFNDILEPLFYEALATDRGEASYYSRFRCKIPFLNGGLFEPIGNYSWEDTEILISDSVFKEVFDTFDLYNFTVREDEPLEKEVAVDPEMLGKVFENLLEVKDRHDKGAYYTPREIVHYMCRESLINYLDSTLNGGRVGYAPLANPQGQLFDPAQMARPKEQLELAAQAGPTLIPREDLETFIRVGEFGIENDQIVEEKGRETGRIKYKVPESIRDSAKRIDEALEDIKICDPAIGSGAFPVGMLHEVVRARETLSTYLKDEKERTVYNLKRHAIQESIYGVDIDCGAVDIAKLRLWLSLVVDEDDFLTIKPLPNLDYKIVCGNSLIGFPENWSSEAFDKIEKLKREFYDTANFSLKADLKARINPEIQARLVNSEKVFGHKVNFDFKLFFSEVWHKKNGFDVVIANPPYIDSESMSKGELANDREIISKTMHFTRGNWDIYIAFFEKGLSLLNKSGVLVYITPDKWLSKPFGEELRKNAINNFIFVVETGREVFLEAKVDSVITGISKCNHQYMEVGFLKDKHISTKKIDKNIIGGAFSLDWLFSDHIQLLLKFERIKTKLKDIGECESACATSDAYKLKQFIKSGTTSILSSKDALAVINTGTIGKYISKWKQNKMTYLKDKYEFPYVMRSDFLAAFSNTYGQKSIKPKIIIKGLTLLDACIDIKGNIVPGKSTLVVTSKSKENLYFLLLLLNTPIMFFYIKEKYRGSSYNQGITFTKDMVNDFPVPKNALIGSSMTQILADYMMQIEMVKYPTLFCFFQNIINGLFYELYFPEELDNIIFKNLVELKHISNILKEEDKILIIQSEFNRLYDFCHPVRKQLEAISGLSAFKIISESQ